MLVDATKVQAEAKKELVEEATKAAKDKLKELYSREEKAKLVVRNVQAEIAMYLQNLADLTTYEDAGVNTTK